MYDFVIIGGGIIGMSTAMQLIDIYPDARIALLEKEPGLSPDGPQQRRNPCRGLLHARQPEGAVLPGRKPRHQSLLRSKRHSLRQLRQDAGRHV